MLSKSIVRELKSNRAVIAAYQFGSYGTKRHGPLSDVDVCLFTKELTSAEVLNLASYGSDKLDISIFDQLPMYIKPEVFRGKPLFSLMFSILLCAFLLRVISFRSRKSAQNVLFQNPAGFCNQPFLGSPFS